MGNRSESLVGQSVNLGLRHIYSGVLTDAYQILGVRILNAQYQQIGFIPGASVQHLDLGTYQVTAPGSLFTGPGLYHDVWELVPVSGASQRNLTFDINVVTVASQQVPNFSALLSCTLADLDACLLKKNYLWPVWQVLANGYYLSDSVLQWAIDTGITYMQRQLGIPLRHVRVLTKPYADDQTPVNPVKGVDYEEDGQLIQWSAIESQWWSSVRLPRTGIIRVRSIRGIYGGKTVYRIPNDWIINNELRMGVIRIRPTTAGALNNIVDSSGRFLDVTLLEALGNNFVPGFWAVDYDYGQENGELPKEICDVIMKKAAVTILDQLGMSISKGLASRAASVDGLSTSVGFVASAERSMFGALSARYEQELDAVNLTEMRKYYKGPSVFIF